MMSCDVYNVINNQYIVIHCPKRHSCVMVTHMLSVSLRENGCTSAPGVVLVSVHELIFLSVSVTLLRCLRRCFLKSLLTMRLPCFTVLGSLSSFSCRSLIALLCYLRLVPLSLHPSFLPSSLFSSFSSFGLSPECTFFPTTLFNASILYL